MRCILSQEVFVLNLTDPLGSETFQPHRKGLVEGQKLVYTPATFIKGLPGQKSLYGICPGGSLLPFLFHSHSHHWSRDQEYISEFTRMTVNFRESFREVTKEMERELPPSNGEVRPFSLINLLIRENVAKIGTPEGTEPGLDQGLSGYLGTLHG